MRKPTTSPAMASTLPRLLFVLLASAALPVQAQSADSIGLVIAVKGQVEARDANGALRPLRRKSDLFEADTILVGADGYAQVKMVDDATLALKANSEFAFTTYDFDNNSATPDSAAMSMIRGGFMTISGTIGDADQDAYRIDTPYASIGIRGTVHSAVIADGVLYTGVYEGGTTISNNEGSIDAGIGADFDFTETHENEAPHGLVEAPPVLGQLNLAQIADQAQEQDDDDSGAAATDDDAAATADGNNGAAGNNPAAPAANAVASAAENNAGNDAAPNFASLGTGNTTTGDTAPFVLPIAAPAAVDNSSPGLGAALDNILNPTSVIGGSPQDEVNPVLFSRTATELPNSRNSNDSPGTSNGGSSSGNSSSGNSSGNNSNSGSSSGSSGGSSSSSGNGNSSGSNNSNSSNGNSSSGNSNSSSGSSNSNSGNGNSSSGNSNSSSGSSNSNSGNGNSNSDTSNPNSGNSSSSGGGSGTGDDNSSGGNSGTSNGNSNSSTGNGNSGSNGGNSGNGNSGSNGGNSSTSNGNNGSSGGNSSTSNGNSSSSGGNPGNGNSGSNTGNSNSGRNLAARMPNEQEALTALAANPSMHTFDPIALMNGWGYWNSGRMLALQGLPDASASTSATANAIYVSKLANMADLSGTVGYQSGGLHVGVDQSGTPLHQVDMSFLVDLRGGPNAISHGLLTVLDGSLGTWRASFNGDVVNAWATMKDIAGTYNATQPVSGAIEGVFTQSGAMPTFTSGFILQSGDSSVQGLTLLNSTCMVCE